jgi:hypothetical protein
MAAHVPRRIFATPFVLTLAATACNSGTAPPPKDPDPAPSGTAPTASAAPTTSASAAPTTSASAAPTATVAASATGSAPPAAPEVRWTVDQDPKTKKCVAFVDYACAPGVSCNPPQPQDYACPKAIAHYPANVVRKSGATECTTRMVPDMSCPKGMHCNPPPPHDEPVPCPK